ncbi:hypothetical protein [Streptomyces chrestomyceticus]|uniref:Integral membrane protein n=1 Tax=Streptomyces chrestomyceticus TaxID=68185 RepID=A0ABU7X660_9ACTN
MKIRTAKWMQPARGAVVVAVGVAISHVILSAGFAEVRAARRADPYNTWASSFLELGTQILGLGLAMPLVLMLGMRLLGAKEPYLRYVLGCSLVWALGASITIKHVRYLPAGLLPTPLLVGMVLLGALLAFDFRRYRSPGRIEES